ncbi:unnamed protein product [Mesocestoides corti]|uniref:BZIP domain-containing protein n=1 Tax=Mesocestoides corti TaxID=53468 RepID=A0A0R3UF39_MESCO|nr:unnamed protein product [Mesocestoides corti]
MAHSSVLCEEIKFSASLEDSWLPSEPLEDFPWVASLSDTSFLLPTEDDLDPQEKVIDYSSTPQDFAVSCCAHTTQLPADLIDFVTSYAFSSKASPSYAPQISHLPVRLNRDILPIKKPKTKIPIHSSPIKTHVESQQAFNAPRRRKNVDREQQLKKRQLNRDAAFRYRQKMKESHTALCKDLSESIEAFKRARKEYERARDAFDALKRVVLDIEVPDLKSVYESRPTFF